MKKVILSLLLVLTVTQAFAILEAPKAEETPKFAKGKGAILLDDLKEGTVYGSLEKIAGKSKAKSTRLVGQLVFDAPKDKLLSGNKFVLIGWLGVQKVQDPSKVVMFKEPIVSSFVVQKDTDAKGVVLPTFGEKTYLEDALQRLEAGETDSQEIKKKRKIKIPTGNQELLLPNNSSTKNSKDPASKPLAPDEDGAGSENSDLSASASEQGNTTVTATGNSVKGEGTRLGSRAGNLNRELGMSSSTLPAMQSHTNGRYTDYPSTSHSNPAHQPIGASSQDTVFNRAKQFSLHVLPQIDENNLPHIQGDAVVLVRKENGKHQAYIVRDGVFSKGANGNPFSKEVSVNLQGLTVSSSGRVEKTPENEKRVEAVIDEVFFNFSIPGGIGVNEPDLEADLTIESTEEGCFPEHNEAQETVTIMRRMKTFKDGALIEQGDCQKTLEIYGVKKDYLCAGCEDEIKHDEKKAYPRYQEYWIDREQQRRNLNIKIDLRSPMSLIEEPKDCGFDTEVEVGFAIQKSTLGYINRFGAFNVVAACRVIEGAPRFPIEETTHGCSLIHDFESKVSYEQKRSFFRAQGVKHEVTACQRKEPAIPHKFVKSGCQAIVDVGTGTVTHMAKRQIQTNAGLKFITSECEPIEIANLLVTREGCEGQYVHDLVIGKSFLKNRYYLLKAHDLRHFVTGCIRSDEYLPHQTEHHGEWVHDDTLLVSRPKLSLYINCPERGKTRIEEPKVRGILGQKSYDFVKDEVKPTSSFYFEGCFRRTRTDFFKVYKRADNSLYEKLIGPGNPIVSTVNECSTRTEKEFLTKRAVPIQTLYAGSIMRGITNYNIFRQRAVTIYPDGTVTPGQWQEVSEPLDTTYSGNGPSGSN